MQEPPSNPPDSGTPPDDRAEAWNRFYAHCFHIINQCPFVRRLNVVDREDCVQEVMMEIVRKLGQLQPEVAGAALTGWIRTVSRNKAINITRQRYRKPEIPFDDGAGAAVVGKPTNPTPAIPEEDSLAMLWEALVVLDEKVTMSSYVIFYLRNIENWPITEIAEVFNITPEQTRFKCHRVRKRFSEILKTKEDPRKDGESPEA